MNMSLREYKEKRNFKTTAEPPAKEKEDKSSVLHFVVQKHRASHLHYDFRIELNGVLKSWAVPKGPSLNPNDKRLAMMVEDHPFEYRKFEGMIPKGEYGGGEVIIWDEGVYSSIETADPKESRKILNAGLAKGHLSLLLQGEKLKGVFDLIKIKEKGKEDGNSWLLVKRPDEYASTKDVLKNNKSVVSGLTVEDIKIATGEENQKSKGNFQDLIVSAPKAEMPHYIKPMLAVTVEEAFNRPGWIFEIKWDGYRAIAEKNSEMINLYSRNQNSFLEKYPEIVSELKKVPGQFILDGEIVVLNDKGEPDFQLMQNYAEEKKGHLIYYVFDLLYLDGRDLRRFELGNRKEVLKKFLPEIERVRYSDHVSDEGIAFFDLAVGRGLEGVIAKDSRSIYREGVRTREWLKIKKYMREEAVIGGFTEPRLGRSNLGALILGKYDDRGNLIFIGHAGGGLDDKKLKEIRASLEKIERLDSPFATKPLTNTEPHWVNPVLVCEVSFSNWTNEGHLRQPIFIGLREDKKAEDVIFEKNQAIEKFFKTEIKEKERIVIEGREMMISNPSKIYWPEDGYTKRDLVEYYIGVGDFILPYLKDRPESMLRHPNGINAESFFQKNMEDAPGWAKIFPFRSDSEEREIKYFICNDLPSLVFMINLGCIEINPWSSRYQKPNYPDFMIIDLDPEDISFDHVVESALEVKNILDKMNVKSYCKTSGKSGMHICVPLGAKYDYDQVKNFCELVVRLVHERLPESTSIIRDPAKRKGKVYLDYMQNRKGQTISAPYSVRPVKGASISTPLKWEEVKKGINPVIYNMKTIFERLKRVGDIWEPVLGEGTDLKSALEKLNI